MFSNPSRESRVVAEQFTSEALADISAEHQKSVTWSSRKNRSVPARIPSRGQTSSKLVQMHHFYEYRKFALRNHLRPSAVPIPPEHRFYYDGTTDARLGETSHKEMVKTA